MDLWSLHTLDSSVDVNLSGCWREGKLFLFVWSRLHLKIFLSIYMNKDQILTWLVVKSKVKSQIIWIKPSRRSESTDPLLHMHARRHKKAGWTPIFTIQSNEGGEVLVWHFTPVWRMLKKCPTPRRKGQHQGEMPRMRRRDLSLFSHLSLSLSLLSIWFVCYVSIGRNFFYL